MAGERFPTEIKLHQKSRVLEIAFSDGYCKSWPRLAPSGSSRSLER
jgi:DUF971 family protein